MDSSIEEELLRYDAAKQQGRSLPAASLSRLLRKLRMSKLRRPDVVLDNWKAVLNVESGSEGDFFPTFWNQSSDSQIIDSINFHLSLRGMLSIL